MLFTNSSTCSFAAAVGVAVSLFAGGASAQQRLLDLLSAPGVAASSPRGGEIQGSKFYESFSANSCADASFCVISFAQVPNGLWLKATNINCFASIDWFNATPGLSEWTLMHLVQGPLTKPVVKDRIAVRALDPEASPVGYPVNERILSFFKGGHSPKFLINAGQQRPLLGGECKLSGELVVP